MARRAADLRPLRESDQIGLDEVAKRAGIGRGELEAIFRREALEPTFSPDEVAQRFGCTVWQVNKLVQLGKRHGARLHPINGGLYPTFKPSHKSRRIPLSAIERHERHMARVHDGVELEHRGAA